MKIATTIRWTVVGALGIFVADVSCADAQSALGGAKTQQNKLGGVAKPAPVIGGATVKPVSPPSPPKPAPVIGMAKPNSPGTPAPASIGSGTTLGQTAAARQNPPVTPPNKGGTVVTTSTNLKCGSGACTSRVAKP